MSKGGSLETQLAGWEIHRLYVYTVYVYVYIYIIRPAPHGLILSLDVFRCKTPCGNKTNAIALTSRREKTISEAWENIGFGLSTGYQTYCVLTSKLIRAIPICRGNISRNNASWPWRCLINFKIEIWPNQGLMIHWQSLNIAWSASPWFSRWSHSWPNPTNVY